MANLPNDIDGVIERLEAIIKDSIARQDRLGYFAALYNRVTIAVRDGIKAGQFQDGARMEKLDVIFANRYLAAYDAYRSGELPSLSWFKAFNAALATENIVLQHLLVGMNAHINLDLGVAAARVAGPGAGAIDSLQGDFNKINDVLAGLTPVVEQQLDDASPVFKELSGIAPRLELKMVGFSMEKARAAAWAFAKELAPLRKLPQVARMAVRDSQAALLAEAVLSDGLVVRLIRAREKTDVARNIQILARGEFKNTVPALIGAPAAPAVPAKPA